MRFREWRRAAASAAALGLLLVSAGTALAGRAWTIDASPSSLDENNTVTVSLDVTNTGGDGGGDEIGCVVITIPAEFTIEDADVASVKGASSGHGWIVVRSGSKVAFMEPDDSNVLVGLPQAGDSAVFRVTVTPTGSGSSSWTALAYDKPGSGTTTKCGSGTFPTKSLSFSVGAAPTPRPTPAPTPRPTSAPTPRPTPAPTPAPTAPPTPAPTRTPAPTPAPSAPPTAPPTPKATAAPTATPRPTATAAPGPTASASAMPGATASASAPAGPGAGAGPTASPSGEPIPDATAPTASSSPQPIATPELIAGATGGGQGSGGSGQSGDGTAGPAGAAALTVGRSRDGRDAAVPVAELQDAALAAFGAIGLGAFTVPGLVVGVPGLLVVLAVVFQLVGGSAFVPIARRWQRGIGLRRPPIARIVRTP
jgi:hypothetical protein